MPIALATEAIEGADDQFSMGALVYPLSSVLAFRGDADGAADAIRRAGWGPDTWATRSPWRSGRAPRACA